MSTDALPPEIGRSLEVLLGGGGVSTGLPAMAEISQMAKLSGDGSSRRFWRLAFANGARAILIAPENTEAKWLREAAAVWHIGRHLRNHGVALPELYGFESASGVLLCEDLGSTHLQTIAAATEYSSPESVERLRHLYRQTLEILATMQCRGAVGFDCGWCWDTERYDRQVMLERESGYFLRAFWQGLLGQQVPDGLQEEFSDLATVAASAPAVYFLHRDFQSRNLMIADGRVRVIDFQGGRLGPLGYDLASLLLDPYAALPEWLQAELYDYYLLQLKSQAQVDLDEFHRTYRALALQRNLQILGAFAHLSAVCGKMFFAAYLAPALSSLVQLATTCRQPALPLLAAVAEKAQKLLR